MKTTKKKFAKETPPMKYVSEVARLRELQRNPMPSEYWMSEIAVQLARLVAQLRYSNGGEYGDYNDFHDGDVPF